MEGQQPPKVVPLRASVRDDCVRMCEEALEAARSGEMQELVLIWKDKRGGCVTEASRTDNIYERVGHLTKMITRLTSEPIEKT